MLGMVVYVYVTKQQGIRIARPASQSTDAKANNGATTPRIPLEGRFE
jgi:hypothetical protein